MILCSILGITIFICGIKFYYHFGFSKIGSVLMGVLWGMLGVCLGIIFSIVFTACAISNSDHIVQVDTYPVAQINLYNEAGISLTPDHCFYMDDEGQFIFYTIEGDALVKQKRSKHYIHYVITDTAYATKTLYQYKSKFWEKFFWCGSPCYDYNLYVPIKEK